MKVALKAASEFTAALARDDEHAGRGAALLLRDVDGRRVVPEHDAIAEQFRLTVTLARALALQLRQDGIETTAADLIEQCARGLALRDERGES